MIRVKNSETDYGVKAKKIHFQFGFDTVQWKIKTLAYDVGAIKVR